MELIVLIASASFRPKRSEVEESRPTQTRSFDSAALRMTGLNCGLRTSYVVRRTSTNQQAPVD